MQNVPDVFRISGFAVAAIAALAIAGCGGGGGGGSSSGPSSTPVSMSGTAATGKAIANANVVIQCVRGSASATTNANGQFSMSLSAILPCVITLTAGTATLHSVAAASGTYNITPETELMLDYLAAQMGTTISGMASSLGSSLTVQQVLGSLGDIENAEVAVVQSLDKNYTVTLTVTDFLTQPFTVGQPGEDADLETLNSAGAIDASGQPVAVAVSSVVSAGSANPIPAATGSASGSGSSGGPGSGVGGMGGMM